MSDKSTFKIRIKGRLGEVEVEYTTGYCNVHNDNRASTAKQAMEAYKILEDDKEEVAK